VRPPLAGESSVVASLEDLDRGLADCDVDSDACAQPSPMIARLVIPESRRQQRIQQGPDSELESGWTVGHRSTRTIALVVILAMFFGVSAAFVFHEGLSHAIVQWQTWYK